MEEKTNYCRNCGVRLEPGAIFCRSCGTRIRGDKEAPSFTEPPEASTVVEPEVMPLFDPRRRYYRYNLVFNEIYDEKASVIGHIFGRKDGARELREADDRTVSAVLYVRPTRTPTPNFDIMNGYERLLARVKHNPKAFLHPEPWLEDPRGSRILEAKGNLFGFKFKVHDMAGNLVAEVEKPIVSHTSYRVIGKHAHVESTERCTIVINGTVDHQLLLPFAMAMERIANREVVP